jgi:hypothetical protein
VRRGDRVHRGKGTSCSIKGEVLPTRLHLLQSFRKHRLIADIVANYDYDRAKVFHSKLDKAAHDEMVVLRQQGLSYGEIARRYEVSKQSVMAVVKRRL